ncbi:transcriptional regulator [Actinoalloteichus sp. AHMU CJ021]|uniref:AfsR/SARP family transcriptional regulator n=1 Tax=Actinoalloteichus sp. AHMU CJ021 TaxID=2072503 RepID=UPI000CA006C9|nr:transcriptional regulator [Actinoalloteichus sp. AHMU CJ021]
MDTPEFRIMGPLRVLRGGRPVRVPGARDRVVLSMLALDANRVVSVDRLIDAVWAGAPPRSARGQIAICVSRLRRALDDRAGDEENRLIVTASPGYQLRVDRSSVDWLRFTDLVTTARRLSGVDKGGALQRLRDALALFRGTPFDGTPGMRCEADRLAAAWLETTEARVDLELDLGNHHEVIGDLTAIAAEHPLRERTTGQLMTALYRAGRRAEALRVYQDTRRQLVEQLGLEPGPELRRLHERMLRDAPGLLTPADPSPPRQPGVEVPSQLPPQPLPFAGRTEQVLALDLMVRPPTSAEPPPEQAGATTFVLTGRGGVGKTALALRWAHQRIGSFPDGQLFADLRGSAPGEPVDPSTVLDRFLRGLGVPTRAVPADPTEKVALFRSATARRRLLVVLDDAGDASQVLPLLPGGAACRVLVTSRDPLDELVALQGAHRQFVRPLADDELRELLVALVGSAPVAAEPQAVARIAVISNGLPLPLRMAAARLSSQPYRTLGDLAATLSASRMTALPPDVRGFRLDREERETAPTCA